VNGYFGDGDRAAKMYAMRWVLAALLRAGSVEGLVACPRRGSACAPL